MSVSNNEGLRRSLQEVNDERSFLRFVTSLGHNRADEVAKEATSPSSPWGPGANGWENGTIESFLLAAATWAGASAKGLELADYEVPSNPWKRCAEILYAGKTYE